MGRAVVVGNADLGPLHISSSTTATATANDINDSNLNVIGSERLNKLNLSQLDQLLSDGTEVVQQWLGTGSRTNSSKSDENILIQVSDMILKGMVEEDWSLEDMTSNLMNITKTKLSASTLPSSFPNFSNATTTVTSLLASAIEPETTFINKEVQFLQSILDGRALEHHLEPSYYQALESVISKLSGSVTLNAAVDVGMQVKE